MLNDNVSATFDHSTSFYVVGSLVWSVVIGVVGMLVLLRAYRKE